MESEIKVIFNLKRFLSEETKNPFHYFARFSVITNKLNKRYTLIILTNQN